MRIVHLDKARPGDILGKELRDERGTILLGAGVSLTQDYIESLRGKGFYRLFVRDPGDALATPPEEDLRPEVRAQALRVLNDAYETVGKELSRLKNSTLSEARSVCDAPGVRALMGESGILAGLPGIVSAILGEVLTRSTLAGITSIKSKDGNLHNHSIDVCVVALMIGRCLGQTNKRMRQLATGCLMHDVGLIFLDKNISQRGRIIQHTQLGYELLRGNEDPDILAPYIPLEHHEHQDGTGLPRGLVGSNRIERDRDLRQPVPTLLGEIAAVANAYDNLLSDEHNAITPDQALALMRQGAGTVFNREVFTAFLRVVPVYPAGLEITVGTGPHRMFTGQVVRVNPASLDRPVIALTRDRTGGSIEPFEIDLRDEPATEIRARIG
jgi:HD-GYP domain-containing protein (c-di-GMP phosphodiesterase class II)